jgi:hypothetical protein
MRLITPDRKVYSFGINIPPETVNFIFSDLLSNFLTTADAKVSMMDYDEFRPHEGKVVTSIPLTAQRSENILNFLNELNGKQVRFQYARQSCGALMHEVLKRTGYDIDIRTTGFNYFWDALPSLTQIPVIAKVQECLKRIWASLPQGLTYSLEQVTNVALFVPRKLLTIVMNLAIWKLGGAKKTTPLQDGVEEEELYDKKGFQNFSSVIRSWTDIFKDETSAVYHTKYFLDWQREQRSTFIDPYQGQPKLSVVPPAV